MNLKETLKLETINSTKERVVCKTRSRRFVQRLVVEREREEDLDV